MTIHAITSYGAVGDGHVSDTEAIQRAIDACHREGGGTVLVPSGHTFRSGSIELRSGVKLHVERGAVLQASGEWNDYTHRRRVGALSAGIVQDHTVFSSAFINATGATAVAITGGGIIDGAGRFFVEEDLGPIYRCPNERPFTVFLVGCVNVTITDVTFRDAALWTVRLSGCDDVAIRGIRIDNDLKMPNSDGIDLDRCRFVRVSDCHIVGGDDAISLKTCEEFPEYGGTEDVVVSNCTLMSTSSALVVGVDAVTPIRNVTFTNCVIRSSHRGLSVNCGQEGDFENILFSHMIVETRVFDDRWWGRGEPIYVSAEPWHDKVGHIRNVRFHDVLARSENGVYVAGAEPGLIDGVLFSDVRVNIGRWSSQPVGHYDRRPTQRDGIYAHRTAGFHIDTANDVRLRDCEVAWDGSLPDTYGPAIETYRATSFEATGFRGAAARPGVPAIVHH